MKNWDFTLGVDVSKNILDVCCAEIKQHIQIKNGTEGFIQFKKWCRTFDIKLQQCFLVMEYTGGYEYKLIQFCESNNISYTRIPGLAQSLERQTVQKLRLMSKRFGHLPEKNFIQKILKRLLLVFAQSDVSGHCRTTPKDKHNFKKYGNNKHKRTI